MAQIRSVLPHVLNTRARRYYDALRSTTPLVVATGPAGCGKTMHACQYAIESLRNRDTDALVVTRPLVPVEGETIGYLPGDLNDKMGPWTAPVWDQLADYASPNEIECYLREKRIVVAPLSMMRGRTFKNATVIGEEMQNATASQMKMLLTRAGVGTRVVLTGDLEQTDLPEDTNGLADLIERIGDDLQFEWHHVEFQEEDVQRSAFVRQVLQLYKSSPIE